VPKEERKDKEKKEEEKPKLPTFNQFKDAFATKAYYRICPFFCIKVKCPYLKECWGLEE